VPTCVSLFLQISTKRNDDTDAFDEPERRSVQFRSTCALDARIVHACVMYHFGVFLMTLARSRL